MIALPATLLARLLRPGLFGVLLTMALSLAGSPAARAAEDRIESPTAGATVSGRVEVRGTAGAAGPRFRSYRLEFGPGPAPSAWRQIGAERDHSVENGPLGLWETAGLPPGEYVLRLLTFDEAGHETDHRVPVVVAVAAPAASAPTSGGSAGPRPAEPVPAAAPPEPATAVAPDEAVTDVPPEPPADSPPIVAIPVPPEAAAPPPGVGRAFTCPMLYYHEVPRQAELAAQLTVFLQAGYRPVAMGRLVDGLQGRAEPAGGCLVLSFDDGLASQMGGALPVLLRYGVPATFFVMPGFRDGVHRYMGPDDFRALRDAGMEIGSHTLNHPSLPGLLRLNFGAFQSELINSKAFLEAELGQPVELFAYPNGAWDYATADEVRKAGYRAAASTLAGGWQRPDDLYWLRRVRADPWEPPARVLARLRG